MRDGKPAVIRVDCTSASEDFTGLQPESSDSDRGFCLASNPQDVVVIKPEDAPCVPWLIEHHRSVGLRHGRYVIGDDHKLLHQLPPDYGVITYLYDDWALNFRPNQKRYIVTKQMRSKIRFTNFCQSLGLLTPKSWGFNCKKEVKSVNEFSYPCWFKPDLGFTGRGVTKIQSAMEMRAILDSISAKMPFQIQEHLDEAVAFPNVTYFCHNGKAERVMVTGQILSGESGQDHIGNVHSGKNEFEGIWDVTDRIAAEIAKSGMEYYIGIDVAKCIASDGSIYYVVIECNPRPNGSNFSTEAVRRLIGSQVAIPWLAVTVRTRYRAYNQLNLDCLKFNGTKGLLVHVASTLNIGKLGMIFMAPTFEEVQELRAQATAMVA